MNSPILVTIPLPWLLSVGFVIVGTILIIVWTVGSWLWCFIADWLRFVFGKPPTSLKDGDLVAVIYDGSHGRWYADGDWSPGKYPGPDQIGIRSAKSRFAEFYQCAGAKTENVRVIHARH